MRVHTLRSAVRIGMGIAVAASVSVASGEARADTGGGPNESVGTGAFKAEFKQGMVTTIGTDWIGKSGFEFRVYIGLDPVKDGGPLFTVDMPKGAIVQAAWSNEKKIVLKAINGAQTDGVVNVR